MSEPTASWWNDPTTLREKQYRTDANLVARQSIYAYQQPRHDLPALVLDAAQLTGDETVLDVGCGNGACLEALHGRGHRGTVVGVDLSEGMLVAARRRAPRARLVVGDVMRLPVADGGTNVVLALHMLYHAPDTGAAIEELRRITASDGVVVVLLNCDDHLVELRRLMADADEDELSILTGEPRKVTVESAEGLLAATFSHVSRVELTSRLVIPTPEPVLAYARSTIRGQETADWDAFRDRVTQRLPREHPFEVTTHSGVLICR